MMKLFARLMVAATLVFGIANCTKEEPTSKSKASTKKSEKSADEDGKCPDGSDPIGNPPPRGNKLECWNGGQRGNRTRHGLATYWHDNGKKRSEGEYKNGKKHGEWTRWDDDGQALSITYDDGKSVQIIPVNTLGIKGFSRALD